MNSWYIWYSELKKPRWTPSGGTIGIIWTLLYPIIFISFGFAVLLYFQGHIGLLALLPFAINIVSNIAFTPLFMSQRNLALASIDILVVLTSIIWIMVIMQPISTPIFLAQIPYLIWVGLATTLMLSILWLNK